MNKAYVIAPVIGLVLFGVVYWNTISEFDTREKKKAADRQLAIEAKNKSDFESRKKAIEEANLLQEKRKQEKAEREAREAKEKEFQLKLTDQRDKARDDRDRVLRQVDRLQSDKKIETEALEKIAKDRQNALDEEAFIQKYIKAAEENQKGLQEVLNKIQLAEKAAADAATAALAVKKKS
jgi:hypothetical protein